MLINRDEQRNFHVAYKVFLYSDDLYKQIGRNRYMYMRGSKAFV